MNNRFGLHWANVPISGQLGRWALEAGGDCYLVIDGGGGWIPTIKDRRLNAIIVNRHSVSNWMDMKPEKWADEMADLFHQHKQYTKHVELECEPDIFPNFPGYGQPIIDRLKFAADWNIKVARRLRELCPGVIIHSPPLAHERLDLPQWFEIWKPVMDACDVLDMHCYWEKDGQYYRPGLYDPKESYHRAFRYRKIHDFLKSQSYWKPMMVTECGNFAPDRPDYADELIYYFSELEKDADYMIGACVFILKSNQWNWVNDLTRQPNIESFFKRIANAPKKEEDFPSTGKKEDSGKMNIRVLMPDGKVKTMDLEEYLKGVVPLEMGKDAPLEALKAQAVAARCYAMAAIKSPRHKEKGADICTTTQCQVWGPTHHESTNKAVEATGDVVATHDKEVISAFYFGHCNGKTRKPTTAYPTPWIKDLPYTVPVDCICGYASMYGHGVGMCQRGAMAMARQGASYKQILWHYYRGVAINGETAPVPAPDPSAERIRELEANQAQEKAKKGQMLQKVDAAWKILKSVLEEWARE